MIHWDVLHLLMLQPNNFSLLCGWLCSSTALLAAGAPPAVLADTAPSALLAVGALPAMLTETAASALPG